MSVRDSFSLLYTKLPSFSTSHPFPYVPEIVFLESITTQASWLDMGMSAADTGLETGLPCCWGMSSGLREGTEVDIDSESVGTADGVEDGERVEVEEMVGVGEVGLLTEEVGVGMIIGIEEGVADGDAEVEIDIEGDGVIEVDGGAVFDVKGDGDTEVDDNGVFDDDGDGEIDLDGDGIFEVEGDGVTEADGDNILEVEGVGLTEVDEDGIIEVEEDTVTEADGDGNFDPAFGGEDVLGAFDTLNEALTIGTADITARVDAKGEGA